MMTMLMVATITGMQHMFISDMFHLDARHRSSVGVGVLFANAE